MIIGSSPVRFQYTVNHCAAVGNYMRHFERFLRFRFLLNYILCELEKKIWLLLYDLVTKWPLVTTNIQI